MDYSPYRHRSRYGRSPSFPWQSIFFFLGSIVVGFLLFWGIKSLFFNGDGEMVPARFSNGEASQGEIQLASGGGWQSYQNETTVIEGDGIRSIRGNNVMLQFTNNAKIFLGNGAEVLLAKSRKKEDVLFTDVRIQKGEVWLENSDENANIRLLSTAGEEIVAEGTKGEFFASPSFVRVITGENGMIVKKLDDEGKIREEKKVGVGQEIALGNFSIQAYSRDIEISPFFVARKGSINETSSEKTEEKKEEDVKKSSVSAPKIIIPGKNDEVVETSKIAIQISGTVETGTAKVYVQHNDNEKYALSKFEKGQTEWSYFANIHAGNLIEGENVYLIFAEDESGVLTEASKLTVRYTGSGSTTTSNSGNLAITSPNGGKDGIISTSVITLSGTAPSNATYLIVENKTKDTSYTLKQFKKGDTTWKYTSSDMDDGSYSMVVKAVDVNQRIIASDKILVTVATKKAIPSPKPSPTPVSSPTASPSPAASTSEAGR